MELRDSGRDLVQINDDGTHAILPVTSRTPVQPDHARVPVMWLRRSDGKLRRDGSRAALLQRHHPVDERGRLHGASGLAVVDEPRVLARIRGPCRSKGEVGQWVRQRSMLDRLRRQDKSRKVRTVGWVRNSARSRLFANIASVSGNLHFSTTCYRRSTIDTLRRDR
jgi:hypothetical protein